MDFLRASYKPDLIIERTGISGVLFPFRRSDFPYQRINLKQSRPRFFVFPVKYCKISTQGCPGERGNIVPGQEGQTLGSARSEAVQEEDMIDFHTHPLLVREMLKKHPELKRIAQDIFYIRNNPQPIETFYLELDVSGLERAVILPIDAYTTRNCRIYSNEQIAELCEMSKRFIGFASVDPHNKNAEDDLEFAVKKLKLRGLKLDPGIQEFYPNDLKFMARIYFKAQELGIPVLFHSGMSWAPKVKAKYSQPIFLEDVAYEYPDLNIVIAHFGWPWVLDSVMLALKYPNVYLDTSCLYFDNPRDFLGFVMTRQIPLSLVEKSLRHKIVFGSNYPRVEIKNMAGAIRALGLSEECLHLIFSENAKKLLGEME